MNATEYKGFLICTRADAQRLYVEVAGAPGYTAQYFNKDGYPTLNHAKGAITKYLKATNSEPVPVAQPALPAAFFGKAVKVSSNILVQDSFKEVHAALYPVVATAVAPVKQSRNKREGKYSGKGGKYADVNGVWVKVNAKHWRTGADDRYTSLKESAAMRDYYFSH